MKKTMMKIKTSLTHNIGIKIIALIVAALIWLTVINITDPEKMIVIYHVPIEMTHEDAIRDMDMVYNVKSEKYVNITVSGKRSVVSKLSAEDFRATASLKELSKVNSIPVEVSARQGTIARKVTIEKQSVQTLMVDVEEIKKQTFDIQVAYTGSAAEGFVPSKYTMSKNSVAITAPASTLKEIDKVVAECQLEGNSVDFTSRCKLLLYDAKGNVIRKKHLTMSSKYVRITVEINQEKEVPIEIGNIGNPASGYEIKNTMLSISKVKLIGDSEVLETIDNISIDQDIDIANAKSSYTKTVDLKKYIPENITINGESTVKVEIEIGPLSTKTITIDASDIKIHNKGDSRVKILNHAKITLKGEESALSNISSKDISASINVDKLGKGEHSVPVNLKVPEEVTVTEEVRVSIKIK